MSKQTWRVLAKKKSKCLIHGVVVAKNGVEQKRAEICPYYSTHSFIQQLRLRSSSAPHTIVQLVVRSNKLKINKRRLGVQPRPEQPLFLRSSGKKKKKKKVLLQRCPFVLCCPNHSIRVNGKTLHGQAREDIKIPLILGFINSQVCKNVVPVWQSKENDHKPNL